MKVTFLGVGSAFSKANSNSNLLVESGNIKLLIDCGPTASASLIKYGSSIADITHIFISHLHADHIGGLEEFAFMSRLVFKTCPKIVTTSTLIDRLWNSSLRGGLEYIELNPNDTNPQTLNDFFASESLAFEEWSRLEEESLELYLHPTNHVKMMESYGLQVRAGNSPEQRFFYSSDTRFDQELIEEASKSCSVIFHDCQLYDAGGNNDLGVHTSYNQLCQLSPEIRQKIWLYHYGDEKMPDAKSDGFAGFAEHLQSFEFPT